MVVINFIRLSLNIENNLIIFLYPNPIKCLLDAVLQKLMFIHLKKFESPSHDIDLWQV